MKKVFLILMMALMSLGVSAQALNGKEYPVYCDLMGYNSMGIGKLKVLLDFGAVTSGKQYESIYGEDGKKMKFNTVIDAVNYLAKRGWVVKSNYDLSSGSKGTVLHFLLEKIVKNDSEIREGLTTKPED